MSGRALVRVLVTRWWVVVLVAAATFGAVVAAFAATDDLYTARTSVVVRSDDPQLDLRLAYYSEELVRGNYNPYADYFAVRDRSAATTGSSAATGELRTTTIVGTDEVTVEIVGVSSTSRGAVELARSAAEGFVAWASSDAPDEPSDALPVRARIAEPPRSSIAPAGPSTGIVVLVAVVAAGALGTAGGLVSEAGVEWANRRRRNAYRV